MVPDPTDAATCTGVTKVYVTATGDVSALEAVDARFPSGRLSVIVGPSGAGKSSLLRILALMDRPDAGEVRIGDVEVGGLRQRARRRLRRRRIGYVFQNPADNLLPYLTVADHVATAARLRGQRRAVDGHELLTALGLDHRLDHRPAQLSGGEQQRLAFAVAAVGRPALILADEPTAELDVESGRRLLQAVLDLRDLGVTVVVTSHDPNVMGVADHQVRLDHGHTAARAFVS